MVVEDQLGITIPDAELDRAKTLRDFARTVQHHLPPNSDLEARSIAIAEDAVRRISPDALASDLNMPLMDAIYPDRWKKARG
jgi:hypothetical protein